MSATRTRLQRTKGYDPEPFDVPPLFQSPPRPVAMLRWLVTKFMWPQSVVWIAIAALMYHFFTPSLARFEALSVDDVGLLWLRNTVLMLIVIGGQHWWLHIRRAQGTEFKYEQSLAREEPRVVHVRRSDPRQHVLHAGQRWWYCRPVRGDHVPAVRD